MIKIFAALCFFAIALAAPVSAGPYDLNDDQYACGGSCN